MTILFYIFFLFLTACNFEPEKPKLSQIKYRITPKENGSFLVEIKSDSKKNNWFILNQNNYTFYQDLPASDEYFARYLVQPRTQQAVSPIKINQNFFQVSGAYFLNCMGRDFYEPLEVHILWNLPNDSWRFVNSFGIAQEEQTFNASCEQLQDALFLGGSQLRLKKASFGFLSITGDLSTLSIQELEKKLEKNMRQVHNFWNRPYPEPYYLVSVIASQSSNLKNKTIHGTAHLRSFQLQLPYQIENSLVLDHLITHEYFHNWNGIKIKANPLIPNNMKWFFEGFTDYYAYLLTSPDSTSYFHSFKEPTFQNISFYEQDISEQNYSRTTYIQGRRLAAWLDKKINQHSGFRLANAMHNLLEKAEQNPLFFITEEKIINTISTYMPETELRNIFQTYIIEGQDPFPHPKEPIF